MPKISSTVLIAALVLLQGGAHLSSGTDTPLLGQMRQDVMWSPSRDERVTQLLKAARVKPDDEVVGLGAGDGQTSIAAAVQFGAPIGRRTHGRG